jgi:hypothetical protein
VRGGASLVVAVLATLPPSAQRPGVTAPRRPRPYHPALPHYRAHHYRERQRADLRVCALFTLLGYRLSDPLVPTRPLWPEPSASRPVILSQRAGSLRGCHPGASEQRERRRRISQPCAAASRRALPQALALLDAGESHPPPQLRQARARCGGRPGERVGAPGTSTARDDGDLRHAESARPGARGREARAGRQPPLT